MTFVHPHSLCLHCLIFWLLDHLIFWFVTFLISLSYYLLINQPISPASISVCTCESPKRQMLSHTSVNIKSRVRNFQECHHHETTKESSMIRLCVPRNDTFDGQLFWGLRHMEPTSDRSTNDSIAHWRIVIVKLVGRYYYQKGSLLGLIFSRRRHSGQYRCLNVLLQPLYLSELLIKRRLNELRLGIRTEPHFLPLKYV